MSAGLRALRPEDLTRAEAVASYLGRFEGRGETARTMRSSLECVARLFPDLGATAATFEWEVLADPVIFDLVQSRVVARYGSATAVKHLSAVRGLLQHLARMDLAHRASVVLAIEGAAKISRHSTPTPLITTNDLDRLIRATRNYPNPVRAARDTALFVLIAATGCRRAEVCRVAWTDIDLDRTSVTFPRTKGGRHRTAPLHEDAQRHLEAWRVLRGARSGPVFCAVRKNGTLVQDQAITPHQVWKLLRSYVAATGIAEDVTPHSLRVWFVTNLLERGADLLTVTRAVGHASPNTTGRYDRRGDEALRAAVALLEIPSGDDVEPEPLPDRGADPATP